MESFRVVTALLVISFASTLVFSAEEELIFTSVPDSITFNTVEALHSSDVANMLSAMLAYTPEKPYTSNSLGPVNPQKRPEAIFVVDLLGVGSNLNLNLDGTKFPMENLNDLDGQYAILAQRTNERFKNSKQGKPVLLKMSANDELYGPKSAYQQLLKSIPADSAGRLEKAKEDPDLGKTLDKHMFNDSNQADSMFLVELETMKLLLKSLLQNKAILKDNVPDIYWVSFESLHGIVQEYGLNSEQTKKAVALIEQMCMEVSTTIESIYPNAAVVAVITETSLPSMTRTARSLLQEKAALSQSQMEVVFVSNYTAYPFDNNFHVAFGLITFTSVLLILTVLGVSVGMWFMDPGRDSIIYRMTSQRKKD